MTDELWVCHLPAIEYRAALELQERVRAARQRERVPDTLLLLEHPPVYTRGRRSDATELTMGEAWYRERGIDIVDTNRGGRVTYHGPGQLVGYPIMKIDDVIAYLRTIERAIVATLADEPFVTFRTGSRLRELLDSGAAGAGFEPRIALESIESRRIRSLVSGGLGVAILPRSDAGGAGAPVAVVRLVDPEMRRDVSLASRAGRRHSPAATAFLALTRRVYEPRQDQAPPPAIIEP